MQIPTIPPEAILVLEGTVIGKPATAGSKRTGVVTVKGPDGKRVPKLRAGRVQTFTADDQGEQGKAFRSAVIDVVSELHTGPPIDAPLVLELTEYRPRSSAHFGTGRNAGLLKGSAPAYPAVRPDLSKVIRAFEDAIAQVVIREDSRICRLLLAKDWDDGPARIEFRLWTLPRTVRELESPPAPKRPVLHEAGNPVTLPGIVSSPEPEGRDESQEDERSGPDGGGARVPLFPGL